MSTLRTTLGLTTAALAALTALGAPAVAQESGSAAKVKQHCAVVLDTGKSNCFDTYREAVAFGSQGRITDAPATAKEAMADRKLQQKLTKGAGTPGLRAESQLLSTFFEHSNFGGPSVGFWGSMGCTDYPWYRSLGAWNDSISSLASGQCTPYLYEHDNYRGFSQAYYGNHAYVGDGMNDRASSILFG